jgi:predicted permease
MDEKTPKTSDRQYYLFALRIAGDFGASIAVPVVIFSIIGRKLDAKLSTGIIYTVIGFVTAALISGTIIYRKAKKYGKEYQILVDKNSK